MHMKLVKRWQVSMAPKGQVSARTRAVNGTEEGEPPQGATTRVKTDDQHLQILPSSWHFILILAQIAQGHSQLVQGGWENAWEVEILQVEDGWSRERACICMGFGVGCAVTAGV